MNIKQCLYYHAEKQICNYPGKPTQCAFFNNIAGSRQCNCTDWSDIRKCGYMSLNEKVSYMKKTDFAIGY